jgi:hypothetical protein
MKSIGIYIFNLDGQHIKMFSKIINAFKVPDITLHEMVAEMCRGARGIIFQYVCFYRVVSGGL